VNRPLKPPVLDDRTYSELRDELIRRIPAHAPEWTHRGTSDPGIALLELFAWLTDNTLYRLNRVPEAAHLEFLRLLGQPLESASVASGFLSISLADPTAGPVLLPYEPNGAGVSAAAGAEVFRLEHELLVLPVSLRAVVKAPISTGDGVDQDQLEDMADWVSARFGTTLSTASAYEPVPLSDGEEGIPSPTRLASTVDHSLWMALLRDDPAVDSAEMVGQLVSFGFLVDDRLSGSSDHRHCDTADSDLAPLEWSIATGTFRPKADDTPDLSRPVYLPVQVVSDSTQGLTRSGRVVVRMPGTPDESDAAPPFGTWTAEDLGDEDLLGVGALPPPLDDKELESVITWVRVRRPDGPHPSIRWVGVNVATAAHLQVARGERLGDGTGRADQRFALRNHPVLPESVTLRVGANPDAPPWQVVPDLNGSGPTDPHFTLDPRTGEIAFGDGLNGMAPRLGSAIYVDSYQHGGGAAGNVSAGTISALRSDQPVRVNNPFAFTGGRDAETVALATRRIPSRLRHRERAVAAQDFVDLAMRVPGVGRAWVLPRHIPTSRTDDVPGVVTVAILPAYDPLTPNTPTPDRELQRKVCEYLDARRLVTTELYVSPPEYVSVWVSASVQVEPGYGEATVMRWVELAIRQYLAPLPPYGPEQDGWPNGRDVWEADLHAAILRVEGVRLVNDVALAGTEIAANGETLRVPDDGGSKRVVRMASWQIPVVENVVLRTGSTGDTAPEIERDLTRIVPVDPSESTPLPARREPC